MSSQSQSDVEAISLLEASSALSAMKQALEILTDRGQLHPDDYKEKKNDAIADLRVAIASYSTAIHEWEQAEKNGF